VRRVSVVQAGDDRAVGKGEGFRTVGLDGNIVAQHCAQAVEAAGLVCHVDEPVVAVSSGHFGNVRRSGPCICLLWGIALVGGNGGHRMPLGLSLSSLAFTMCAVAIHSARSAPVSEDASSNSSWSRSSHLGRRSSLERRRRYVASAAFAMTE